LEDCLRTDGFRHCGWVESYNQSNFLRLAHLSSSLCMLPWTDPLKKYDAAETEAQILAVLEQTMGKLVEVYTTILKDGRRIMKVTPQFLYRDTYTNYENTFQLLLSFPQRTGLA